jgi:2-aminoethylphosphonate-pyruvate transaminase
MTKAETESAAEETAAVTTTPVHVVVLAAGRGSRLGRLGDTTPKWLLRVGDRTLAERQLDGVGRAAGAGAVASVRVVVGHAGEEIERALADGAEVPSAVDVEIVRNPDFDRLNNWWSLLLALRALPGDEPVLVINADLLTDPEQVRAFVEHSASTRSDGLLAIDFERQLTDESMKVSRTADGTLATIGKAGVEAPVGEYIGMLMARGAPLRRLRAALEAFVDRPEAANEWYEGAVGATAADGVAWGMWAIGGDGWIEIDDDADLDAAQLLAVAR